MIDLAYNLWLLISSGNTNTGLTLIIFSVILGVSNSRISSYLSSVAQNEILRKSSYDNALKTILSSKKGLKEKSRTVELLRRRFKVTIYTDIAPILPFIGQMPILLTAYFFLENYPLLNGVPFGVLKDLSKPDMLLNKINLLPLLMTTLNILVAIFDDRLDKKQKRGSFVIAAIFLVLLYNKSSALLVYWSISNFILLLKTISRHKISNTTSNLNFIILYALLEGLVWISKDTGMGLLEAAFIFCIVFLPFYLVHTILRHVTNNNLLYSTILIVLTFNTVPIYSILVQNPLVIISAVTLSVLIGFQYFKLKKQVKTEKLNIFLAFLIVVIFLNMMKERWAYIDTINRVEEELILNLPQNSNSPNILHIMLDGYSGEYGLSSVYGYDNSMFLDSLENLGFQISPGNSQSNYSQTHLSLASMLNMTYLDSLVPKTGKDRSSTYNLIRNSAAGKFLKNQNYLYYHFDSGWGGNEQSDIANFNMSGFSKIPAYLRLFLYKTVFIKIAPYLIGNKADAIISSLNMADTILKSKSSQPHYIFLHLMLPHPPYVFNADFKPIETSDVLEHGDVWLNKKAYITAVRASNAMIFQFVKNKFIASNPENLIIIINSDHGSHFQLSNGISNIESKQERMSNITCVYNSSVNIDLVSSPVNLYRILFNDLFNSSYDTLPHTSFYSSYENPFNFEEIPKPKLNHSLDTN